MGSSITDSGAADRRPEEGARPPGRSRPADNHPLLTRRGVRGAALEAAWLATHALTYPIGLAQRRHGDDLQRTSLTGLSPHRRALLEGDIEAAGTPIILVHGVVDNHSVFTVLRRTLRRRGFGRIVSVNYSPFTEDVRRVAQRLSDVIETVVYETGFETVHVVGHSLGGLISRYYVQRYGGHERVKTLITLGTPHAGSATARLVPHPIARQMRPGSDVLTELEQPCPNCSTSMLAIWSDLDEMIVPKRNARLKHPDLAARNLLVRGVGHNMLPLDRRVIHEVARVLGQRERPTQADESAIADLDGVLAEPPRAPVPR